MGEVKNAIPELFISKHDRANIKSAAGDIIAMTYANGIEAKEAYDLAAYIVKAANGFPKLVAEAKFLLARLNDLEDSNMSEETSRDYYGHVAPSISRLSAILSDLGEG